MDEPQESRDKLQTTTDDSQESRDDSGTLVDDQQKVATFIERHDLAVPPEFRLLDVVSEVGEVAKDAAESTEYGQNPDTLTVNSDEVGDVLFSLLALAHELDIDASAALAEALEKYDDRLAASDDPSSGE